MDSAEVVEELRKTIERLIELPELNMDELEFRSEMVIQYAKLLLQRTEIEVKSC